MSKVREGTRRYMYPSVPSRTQAKKVRLGTRPFRGVPGVPAVPDTDLLGQLKDGRQLGLEVKAQAGRLCPEQSLFLERIRRAGGVAFVARDCRDVLRELKKGNQ